MNRFILLAIGERRTSGRKSPAPLVSTGRISSRRSSASASCASCSIASPTNPSRRCWKAPSANRRRPGQRREDQSRAGPDRSPAPGSAGPGQSQANEIDRGSPRRAARVQEQETQKAIAAAEQIIVKAAKPPPQDHARMLAELKREVGRLVVQTTATVTGKILTPEDQRRLAEETRAKSPLETAR